MKRLKLITLALSLASMASAQNKQEDGWKTIRGEGYAINYPDSFEHNDAGVMGTSFILLSPQVGETDLFRENVNLVIQNLKGQKMELDEYVELCEKQVKTMFTEGTILKSERIKEEDGEYHKIIFSAVQGVYTLQFEQQYRIREDKVYVLTFTCEKDEFEEYLEVGEKIMASFKLR